MLPVTFDNETVILLGACKIQINEYPDSNIKAYFLITNLRFFWLSFILSVVTINLCPSFSGGQNSNAFRCTHAVINKIIIGYVDKGFPSKGREKYELINHQVGINLLLAPTIKRKSKMSSRGEQ